MTLLVLVPLEEGLSDPLLPLMGARERLVHGDSPLDFFLTLSRHSAWRILQIMEPNAERLRNVAAAVAQKVQEEGEAVLDLETNLVSILEIQKVAAGLNLSVELVAVLRPMGTRKEPAPLANPIDNDLLNALAEVGAPTSMRELKRRLKVKDSPVLRERLKILETFGRITRSGKGAGVLYQLRSKE